MIGIWRRSRHASFKIPMCFQGMNPAKRVAYVEPYESESIFYDFPHWKWHVFTRISTEKELILSYWWNLRKKFERKQYIVEKRCQFIWYVSKDAIKIILQYSALTIEYAPPKLYFKTLRLIRDEYYICLNDKGEIFCIYCTIYHNNKVTTIDKFNRRKNMIHKISIEHKKAVMRARKYYKELDYCS